MTLIKAVDDFIRRITPTDYQEDSIDASFNNLKRILTAEDSPLSVKEVFMNGSYVRRTIIRPIEDIDVFAVIEASDYSKDGFDPKCNTVLDKFKRYLESKADYKGKCRQSRPCITIDLADKHIDVLPSIRKNDYLLIPSPDLSYWMETRPKEHTKQLQQVNDMRNSKVKHVVMAIKSWKKNNDLKIASFHVEQIAIHVFNIYDFSNHKDGILLWFKYAILSLNSNLCGTQNQYQAVLDSIKNVQSILEDAENKSDKEAIVIWKSVFGSDFPKYDQEQAKTFSKALTEGKLRLSASAGLSMIGGKAIPASKGFYGGDEDEEQN